MLRTTIMAAALLAGTRISAKAQAPEYVSPGDDFFVYANGDWLAATRLPPGTNRWTARNEINELARRQVVRLLDDAVTAPPGSLARKVADFRAAWIDTAAIEAKGIRPLASSLDTINALRDNDGTNWAKIASVTFTTNTPCALRLSANRASGRLLGCTALRSLTKDP